MWLIFCNVGFAKLLYAKLYVFFYKSVAAFMKPAQVIKTVEKIYVCIKV